MMIVRRYIWPHPTLNVTAACKTGATKMRTSTIAMAKIWELLEAKPGVKYALESLTGRDREALYLECKKAIQEALLDSL